MLIFDASNQGVKERFARGNAYVVIICQQSVFGVEQTALIMRSEIARGISLEGKVMCMMQRQPHALDASEVAKLLEEDDSLIWEILERLYFSSKLEKRNGHLPVYRVPGKSSGKLSLPN